MIGLRYAALMEDFDKIQEEILNEIVVEKELKLQKLYMNSRSLRKAVMSLTRKILKKTVIAKVQPEKKPI